MNESGRGAERRDATRLTRGHHALRRRRELRALEAMDALQSQPASRSNSVGSEGASVEDDIDKRVSDCSNAFLEVERYVNVNVTAVRKLLKKHDKVLPQRPIKAFYTARMHDMRWVRNDYSDVVVRLSRLYASKAPTVPSGTESVNEQSFVRATTKSGPASVRRPKNPPRATRRKDRRRRFGALESRAGAP